MASNLGVELHARGMKVSLLDCDPQRSLHSWASLGDGGALRDLVRVVESGQGAKFRDELQQHDASADVVIVDCAPGFDPTVSPSGRSRGNSRRDRTRSKGGED